MIPVEYRVLVQHDPTNKKEWTEFSKKGELPALPPIGTIIFLREDNVNFIVNKIYMINGEETTILIQRIYGCSKEILEAMRENSYKYENSWSEDDLADNSRRVFVEEKY